MAFSVGTKSRRDSVADPALQIGGGRGGGRSKNKGGGGPSHGSATGIELHFVPLVTFLTTSFPSL